VETILSGVVIILITFMALLLLTHDLIILYVGKSFQTRLTRAQYHSMAVIW
jgi:hypothetical protein